MKTRSASRSRAAVFRSGAWRRSSAVIALATALSAEMGHAQCVQTDTAATCTAEGNPYADGIAFEAPGRFDLVLEDGATVVPESATNGLAISAAGGVSVARLGAARIATTGDTASAAVFQADGDAEIDLDTISTAGIGASGLSVFATGRAIVRVGSVDTAGDSSTGIDIAASSPISLTAGAITTAGAGSTGVAVATSGGDGEGGSLPDATLAIDSVATRGSESPGVDVRAGSSISLTAQSISTEGDASPGVTVSDADSASGAAADGGAGARATLLLGSVTTAGESSSGVDVAVGSTIALTANAITTAGDDSPGVSATSRNGDIAISVGAVTVNGSSTGIVATSDGGGVDVSIAAAGGSVAASGVTSADGPALDLSASLPTSADATAPLPLSGDPAKAGIVRVTIGKGATVSSSGNTTINIAAQKGSFLTNDGAITGDDASGGPALAISGGAAVVTNNGSITGSVRLTQNGDTVVNTGRITVTDSLNFDSGDATAGTTSNRGVDTLVNSGTIGVRPGATSQQYVSISGVEVVRNSGLIDLRSGVAGDRLVFARTPVNVPQGSPEVLGQYVASGGATVALDLQFQANGALADTVTFSSDANTRLTVSGTTKLVINTLPGDTPKLLTGLPLVTVPSGSTGTFELAQPLTLGGLQYALIYDPRQTAWALFSAPGAATLRQSKLPSDAQALWHRAGDAVSARLRERRDRRWTDEEPRAGLWLQAVGESVTRSETYAATINRVPVSGIDLSQRQAIYGVLAGIDSAGPEAGETGLIFGATVGYLQSTAQFRATGDKVTVDAVHLGAYASLLAGPAFLTASGHYARHSIDDRLSDVVSDAKIRGDSYGVRVEASARFGSDAVFVEPLVSLAYAVTAVDKVSVTFGHVIFDSLVSENGTAGVRIGGRVDLGQHDLVYYAGGEAVHEFAGDDQMRLNSGGLDISVPTFRRGTYGRATLGLNLVATSRLSAFIEGQGVSGGGASGGGGRIGIRLPL